MDSTAPCDEDTRVICAAARPQRSLIRLLHHPLLLHQCCMYSSGESNRYLTAYGIDEASAAIDELRSLSLLAASIHSVGMRLIHRNRLTTPHGIAFFLPKSAVQESTKRNSINVTPKTCCRLSTRLLDIHGSSDTSGPPSAFVGQQQDVADSSPQKTG